MNINAFVLALLTILVGFYSWKAFLNQDKPPPSGLPWVPVDVRKTKVYVSQSRDAGMYIERVRRQAIISNPNLIVGHKGSTNGSLEWNFLTGICICPPRPCPFIPELSDGGYYDADTCNVLDGMGYDVVDFGNAFTETCDGICPPVVYATQEGGDANADICDVFDGEGVDITDFGGAVEPNVC